MALWGTRDSYAIANTISVSNTVATTPIVTGKQIGRAHV